MIPGFLVAIATFPGVIVHEIAHQLMCRWMGVAVFDVCYFRLGNPAGYVIHERPRSAYANLLITVGPFLVNTILGVLIVLPAAIPVLEFGGGTPMEYVLAWLGISITMHAFPSTGDARSMWAAASAPATPVAVTVLATPLVGLIYIGAIGSIFWLDLIYGIGVSLAVPKLLIALLA